MFKIFLLLASLFSLNTSFSQQASEAFSVRIFDQYVQVLAPDKIYAEQSVVIENRTLTRVVGRLQGPDGTQVRYLAIDPARTQVVSIPTKGVERLIFIPLSPSFQEVELKIGTPSYEIPPQR